MSLDPKNFFTAFEEACKTLAGGNSVFANEAVKALERDDRAVLDVQKSLKEMGCTRFVNLAKNSFQSKVSWVTYTGDGIVAKITPEHYAAHSPVELYEIPAIDQAKIIGKKDNFIVRTYPWIKEEGSRNDVEVLRMKMDVFGIGFQEGDDRPDNIRCIADEDKTATSIDDDVFCVGGGIRIDKNIKEQWISHVRAVYDPAYGGGIRAQRLGPLNVNNFELFSPHADNAHLMSFNPNDGASLVTMREADLGKPIEEPMNQGFGSKIYHFFSRLGFD